jgi:hypothetical protein
MQNEDMDVNIDKVFESLADPGRRQLLDRLHAVSRSVPAAPQIRDT